MSKRPQFSETRSRTVGLERSGQRRLSSDTVRLQRAKARLYGPSPRAVDRVHRILANERRTCRQLTALPLRLIDVAELTDGFLGTEQPDARANNHTVPKFEQKRKDFVAAGLQGQYTRATGPARRSRVGCAIGFCNSAMAPTLCGCQRDRFRLTGSIQLSAHREPQRPLCDVAGDTLRHCLGVDGECRSRFNGFHRSRRTVPHFGKLCADFHVFAQVAGLGNKCLQFFQVFTRASDEWPAAMDEQMMRHVNASSASVSNPPDGVLRVCAHSARDRAY
ncbi:hypothetical protein ACVMB1_000220 [Bradyrhizobium sp. USDA 4504]